MKAMTMKERIIAVLKGEQLDRVPFVTYNNLSAKNEDVWTEVGRENMGLLKWSNPYRIEHPNCDIVVKAVKKEGLKGEHTIITTSKGSISQVRMFDPALNSRATTEHFIKTVEDYDILCAWLEDSVVVEDFDQLAKEKQELGDDGIPLVRVNRTPFQQLWIEWVSIEDLSIHFLDHPGLMQRVIELLTHQARLVFDVIERADIDMVNFPDNITAPLIGKKNFQQYCLPLYQELSERMSERDIPVFVHMDGDLKPLWDDIGRSGIKGLDSFTPPPDNDTSAARALSMWPHMRLFLNFPSSVHMEDEKTIYKKAMEILNEVGHTGRLQIQISENVPPGYWKKSYPQIIKAINDFGKP